MIGAKRSVGAASKQRTRDGSADQKEDVADSSLKRFVTFYFTNFPMQAPNFILRQGFEVCGMLEEVFVPNKLNVNGEAYGFVRFSSVRDVDKLLRAVNNVYFGHMRVKASLARFHKSNQKALVDEGEGKVVNAGEKVGKVGNVAVVSNDVGKGFNLVNAAAGVEKELVVRKDNIRPIPEKVKTFDEGEVDARKVLREEEERNCVKVIVGEGSEQQQLHKSFSANQQHKKLVRMYRSMDSDLKWARKGLIGTVMNGEAIPIIQSRVEDVGFRDVDIIPLGADKVFLHSLSEVDIMQIVVEAKQFFDLLFSNIVRWDKAVVPFQRGAWLRVYGVPVHAWSENCFKLCVLDCRRYLRTDGCTLNRERFDYARVLVATSSLDIVNVTDTILIDGVQVEIKMCEEWVFQFG
jgi:hypothetical protein